MLYCPQHDEDCHCDRQLAEWQSINCDHNEKEEPELREVILATLKNDELEFYPEVIAVLNGELHEGMADNASISINPHAAELQKIRASISVGGEKSLGCFFYLMTRREEKDDKTVCYARVP